MTSDEERFNAARIRLDDLGADLSTLTVVDRLGDAVAACRAEQTRLVQVLHELGGVRSTDELKSALRSRPDPMAPDDTTITALRRRHESAHSLRNRLDELDGQIRAALADLDTLVMEVATSRGFAGVDEPKDVSLQLQRLLDDARALTEARREMEKW